MEIVIALIGLSFIVFVHELGHAIVAKLLGVQVEVFSIGIGKPYLSFRLGETEVRVSPFLFGGYCRMKGADLMDGNSKEVNYHHLPAGSLLKASGWRRALIYVSGPVANILLAFLVFAMVSFLGFSLPDYSTKIVALEPHSRHFHTGDTILTVDGEKVSYYTDILKVLPEDFSPVVFEVERNGRTEILDLETSTVLFMEQVRPWIPLKIQDVQENSPARLAGFKTGDEILSVDGQSVAYFDQLENIKTQNKSGEYTVEVKRGKEVLTLSLLTAMPRWGILFQTPETRTEKATSVGDALSKGVIQTASFMKRAFMGIWGLILSPFAQSSHISGPIGIANQLAVAQSVGFTVWLQLLGFISASLAAMNLFFPISILDGGQIFIIFLEGIRRKRFSPSTLLRIHTVGVFLILGLLLLGVFNDISGLTR